MRKMLEELFYGNIYPNERQFIRNIDFAVNTFVTHGVIMSVPLTKSIFFKDSTMLLHVLHNTENSRKCLLPASSVAIITLYVGISKK